MSSQTAEKLKNWFSFKKIDYTLHFVYGTPLKEHQHFVFKRDKTEVITIQNIDRQRIVLY